MSLRQQILPLADTLFMELTIAKDKQSVSGRRTKKLDWLPGANMNVKVSVLESLLDYKNDMAAMMVTFGGDLNMVVIHDYRAMVMTLMIVDDSKLKEANVFPIKYWSRKETYANVYPAIAAVFQKDATFNSGEWQLVENGQHAVKTYLELREKDEMSSREALKEVGLK